MSKKLILDVDTGTDDAQAIMMALQHEEADVIGITCVDGNIDVDQVCLNTLRVLQVCNRLDIPVYRGASCALVTKRSSSQFYHGQDGMGDCPDPDAPPASLIQQEHAVSALIRLTKQYPGEVTLVALAPLTNVALAIKMDPDFGKRLRGAVIMGGNMSAVGNICQCQEYNFHCDPESAQITLRDLGCPITLLPLEPTVTYGALECEFYDKEIASLTSEKAQFLHKISRLSDKNRRTRFRSCPVCDANAVSLALDERIITKSSMQYCTVELHGEYTRAQVVVDWGRHLQREPNVLLVEKYDLDLFKKMYKKTFL